MTRKPTGDRHATREPRATQRAQGAFLDGLAQGLSATSAANAAGIGRRTPYGWRHADPEFARAWDLAVESGTDLLEDEAWRRAVKGNEEPIVSMGKVVYGKDGEPLTIHKQSDTLMALLLKGRRREKFSDRVSQDIKLEATTVALDGRAAGDIVRERLAQLAERVGHSEPPSGTLQALLLKGRAVSEDDEPTT
jgi:hypothetical protein